MRNLETISKDVLFASIELYLKNEDDAAIDALLHRIIDNPTPSTIEQVAKDYDQPAERMEEILEAQGWSWKGFINPEYLQFHYCVIGTDSKMRITPLGRIKLLLDLKEDGMLPVMKDKEGQA